MDGFRILVANEPRAYRETIAATLRCLRPLADVVAGEPRWMGGELAHVRPHLLIGSDPDLIERADVLAWVLLYPGGTGRVVVCVNGQQEVLNDLPFDDLIAVVDRVERLVVVQQAARVG